MECSWLDLFSWGREAEAERGCRVTRSVLAPG